MRLDIDRSKFAAIINLDVKGNAIAFFQPGHACALNGADVDKGIRLIVIACDETKAFGCIEEFDCARGALACQLTMAACTARGFTAILTRSMVFDRHRFALDLQIDSGHLAIAFDERETERLTRCQALQSRLLNRADVNEDIFAAIVARDKAKTLAGIEKFDCALAFANDLRRHPATASATEAAATTAAAARTVAAAETAAAITAAATTIIAKAATWRAIAVTTEWRWFKAVEISEIIAPAAPPMATAILIGTHSLVFAFGSSIPGLTWRLAPDGDATHHKHRLAPCLQELDI